MGQEEKELGKDDSTEVQSPPDPMESCGGCIATLRLLGLRRGAKLLYLCNIRSLAMGSLQLGVRHKLQGITGQGGSCQPRSVLQRMGTTVNC